MVNEVRGMQHNLKNMLIEKLKGIAQHNVEIPREQEVPCRDDAAMQQAIAALMAVARNEIRLSCAEPTAPLPPCSSKLGGCPCVPENFVWPEYTGTAYDGVVKPRPLSFLAQISLKDVAALDTEGRLPATGMLSFFYELETMKWGFDPKDAGSARVFYFPEENALRPRALPEALDADYAIPELAVSFASHTSLPDFSSAPAACDTLGWEAFEECSRACGYEADGWGDVTKLLGYPDVIQGPMEEECESVTRGFYNGNPEAYAAIPQAELDDIRKKAGEWTLLFQMGTLRTSDMEFMFGDCGHIYFWIRKSELAQRNFENVWLILQCS